MKTYNEEIEKCAKLEGFAPVLYAELIIEHFGKNKITVVKDVLDARKLLTIL